jgi:hypothetical protein
LAESFKQLFFMVQQMGDIGADMQDEQSTSAGTKKKRPGDGM